MAERGAERFRRGRVARNGRIAELLAGAHQDGVGSQGAQPVRLEQHGQPFGDGRCGDDARERGEFGLAYLVAQCFFGNGEPITVNVRQRAVGFLVVFFGGEHADRSGESAVAVDPGCKGQQPDAVVRLVAEGKDKRAPVARVGGAVAHLHQVIANAAEVVGVAAVGPCCAGGDAAKVLVESEHGGAGDGGGDRVDHDSRKKTEHGTREAEPGIEEAEGGSECGALGVGFDERGVVEEPVRKQETHADDRGDSVEASECDRGEGDGDGEQNGAPRVERGSDAVGEHRERGNDLVGGEGLEDARCAEARGHRGRQRGGDDADFDEPRRDGDSAHGAVVAGEHIERNRCGEKHRGAKVDDGGDKYGEKCAAREALCRIAEIAGHAHALGEAGDGGEENRKNDPERKGGALALHAERVAQELIVPVERATDEE